MSTNFDGTVRAQKGIPEDSIEGIQALWEPIAVYGSIVSEELIEAQCHHLGAGEMVSRIREAFAQCSLIPSRQIIYRDCKLPHQPQHTFSVGYVCQSNSSHKFCRLHSLRKCVICGGDLDHV